MLVFINARRELLDFDAQNTRDGFEQMIERHSTLQDSRLSVEMPARRSHQNAAVDVRPEPFVAIASHVAGMNQDLAATGNVLQPDCFAKFRRVVKQCHIPPGRYARNPSFVFSPWQFKRVAHEAARSRQPAKGACIGALFAHDLYVCCLWRVCVHWGLIDL